MISVAWKAARLMGYQLLWKGDRHVWQAQHNAGSQRHASHTPPACLATPLACRAFPRTGGHPTPQGGRRAHRSSFVRLPQKLSQVVKFGVCAASSLYLIGVGVWEDFVDRAFSLLAEGRGSVFSVGGKGMFERTPSGLRPSVDINGAGAPALTRAPASGLMGYRP